MLSTVTSVPALIQSTVPPAASILGLTASYPVFTCAKNGLFSIAMIAILTGLVGFVVLKAGRSACRPLSELGRGCSVTRLRGLPHRYPEAATARLVGGRPAAGTVRWWMS